MRNSLRGFEPLEPRTLLSADSTVVFNEIMYHPADDDPGLEWVELYNQMVVDMDLSGWSLVGLVDFEFAAGTVIPGGGHLVIAADPAALRAATGSSNVLGPLAGNLSDAGGRLLLRNNSDRLMDEMQYDDRQPWPVAADGSGASLAKHRELTPSGAAANWRASAEVGGTPGKVNFPKALAPLGTTRPLAVDAPWRSEASDADLQTGWRQVDFDDGGWDLQRARFSGVLITEAGPRTPDWVEIQNVSGEPADMSGWVLAVNNANEGINVVHPTLWALPPAISAEEVLYRTDQEADNYFGENIFWKTRGPGWVMIVDDEGNVADCVIWGYDASEVASLDVNVNGFNVTAEGVWSGAAVAANDGSGESLQRRGDSDHDTASDFAFVATMSKGEQNEDLTTPFATSGIELTPGPITYYFRTEFDFDEIPAQTELAMSMVVDDGAIFYLNGVAVYRHNMPPGPVSHDTLASTEVGTATFVHDVPLPAQSLVQGPNVLAVEVHQATADDADVLFAAELTATIWPPQWRHTDVDLALNELAAAGQHQFWLELANHGDVPIQLLGYVIASSTGDQYELPAGALAPGEFLSVTEAELGFRAAPAEVLFLYAPGGQLIVDAARVADRLRGRSPDGTGPWLYPDTPTPGAANQFALHDEVVINEIMYHHRAEFGEPFAEIDEEWVEIYNRSAEPVDLGGWRFVDAMDFLFPAGTVLPPDGYLVVAGNAAALRAKYPGIAVAGQFGRGLSNKVDRLVLLDANGNPADEVQYYDDAPWTRGADGNGSSLELRDPFADNRLPEVWAPSDEGSKASWQHYSYTATAINPVVIPTTPFHELRVGLLSDGQVLIDNVSVIEDPAGSPRELIQNGSFSTGADKWRLLGTHSHSDVVEDPDNPGNMVLNLVATGPSTYLNNLAETTFKPGGVLVPVVAGRQYQISFDAKWLDGTPQLRTEIYYNKVAKTTILEMPEQHGTPGVRNSTFESNIGPTYADMIHNPAVPPPSEPIRVSVTASDPDGVDLMTLHYSVAGGGWQNVPMTAGSDGLYTAAIPGQSSRTVIQFYVEGVDGLGATSVYPAAGRDSRALIEIDAGQAVDDKQNFRLIMTAADRSILHQALNILSNDRLGGTIIYNESEVFYNAGVRLRGSMFSRNSATNTGLNLKFPADHLFRGIHDTVTVKVPAIREILAKHLNNAAGGIPGMYDDLVNLINHQSSRGRTAKLSMARFGDVYLDSQFDNGSQSTMFKMEGIRVFERTHNSDPEGIKMPQPIGWVPSYDIRDLGDDKEQYRWSVLINNNRDRDDYSALISMAQAFSLRGAELDEATAATMDVDQWARVFAMASLCGIGDMYTQGNPHNNNMYIRPDDGKIIALPWDWDFTFNRGTSSSLWGGKNLGKIFSRPVYSRQFYYNLYDLINTAYNNAYMDRWIDHYNGLVSSENFSGYKNYIASRSSYVLGRLPARVPFAITTNGGNDFSVHDVVATIGGTAWFDVYEIRIRGDDETLQVTWTDPGTWQVTFPLAPDANSLTFEAIDRDGSVIGTDAITVTSTIPGRPLQEYLRVSELNYNPAEPTEAERAQGFTDNEDFEFIELTNVGPERLNLAGVRFTDGVQFEFAARFKGVPVLISEVGIRTPDYVEVQNVSGGTADTSGWVVAANNGNVGINAVHPTLWTLPDSVAPDAAVYGSDDVDDTAHYWGENIFWKTRGSGWVVMLDGQGNVADFVIWGYDAADVAALDVTINGVHVTADSIWNGPAVEANDGSGESLQRRGLADGDAASDFTFTGPDSRGSRNAELTIPFAPTGIELDPGEFVVVAQNAAAFETRHGEGAQIAGEFASGKLSNGGEQLRLENAFYATIQSFQYDDSGDWPDRADGGGSSLEVLDTGGDYGDGRNWRASTQYDGSPGAAGSGPSSDVVINEVLSNAGAPLIDAIELHNRTENPIDVGGWYLSNADADYRKYRIPDETTIPADGYLVFDETDFNASGGADTADFALDGVRGNDLWLWQADADGRLMYFADHAQFGAAAGDESLGRWPNGQGDLYPMITRTLGSDNDANGGPRVGPVIISEMQYDPGDFPGADGFEFVEIYNPTGQVVSLDDWRLRGDVVFNFADGSSIGPADTLVVLSFDPHQAANAVKWSAFCARYGLNEDELDGFVGGYSGRLSDAEGQVLLQRADEPPPQEPGFIPHLLEDEVRYDVLAPWPTPPEGSGHSLHRQGVDRWGNDPGSWTAAAPTPGVVDLGSAAVVTGRYVFYNNSAFDAAGDDDEAIAPDKQALLQGHKATFANYTSYVRGINGIAIDVAGLADASGLKADDFELKVGNNDDPATWLPAPAPQGFAVRSGGGVDGADRVTLVWDDRAIANQWLQISVRATANTGLAADDVFYFGNAIGEAGNSTLNAIVNTTDEVVARSFQHGPTNPAAIDDPYDYNRDRLVNAIDRTIARTGQTGPTDALRLITVSAVDAVVQTAAEEPASDRTGTVTQPSWLDAVQQVAAANRAPQKELAAEAVDALLAIYWP